MMDENMMFALAKGASKRMQNTVDAYEARIAELLGQIEYLAKIHDEWKFHHDIAAAAAAGLREVIEEVYKLHPNSPIFGPTSSKHADGEPKRRETIIFEEAFKRDLKDRGYDNPEQHL